KLTKSSKGAGVRDFLIVSTVACRAAKRLGLDPNCSSQKLLAANKRTCDRRQSRISSQSAPLGLGLQASVELAAGRGLVEADAAGGDFGFEIVLALELAAREAAEHGELADVGE